MFYRLTNFSYKRNFQQVLGFYFFYLTCFFILLIIIATATYIIYKDHPPTAVLDMFANITVPVISVAFTTLMLYQKKLLSEPMYIFLAIMSAPLGNVGGLLLGLIPAAYLSSK